jgi:hypothetical protein
MTVTPNATVAPTPTSSEPEPPGGGGEPPGGGGEPPGGGGAEPPGGGGPEPPGPPGSPGGEPPAPGGGGAIPPGSKQISNDNLSVTLPPFALRFFLSNQQHLDDGDLRSDLFVKNQYPTHSDYAALESVTDLFVKNYVMETIGNGLNVVLDDFKTIILSKQGVQHKDGVAEMEITRTGAQNLESIERAAMPYESLYTVFASTAAFDATSPTLPHPYDLLKHVQDAFRGDSLVSYLSMLQALQHENATGNGSIFAMTTDVIWVPTTSANVDPDQNSQMQPQDSSNSDLGALIAVFSIAILILFMMILRLQFFGTNKCWPRQSPSQERLSEFEQIFRSSSKLEIYKIDDDNGSNKDDAGFVGGKYHDAFKSSGNQGDLLGDADNSFVRARDPPGIVLDVEFPETRASNNTDNQKERPGAGALRRFKKGIFT